jgi:hypothetical protein
VLVDRREPGGCVIVERRRVLAEILADAERRPGPGQHHGPNGRIGCDVLDADDPAVRYGTLSDVSKTGANDVWHVTNDAGQEFLLPAIPPVVIDTDVEQNVVRIRPLKGIFDDAD